MANPEPKSALNVVMGAMTFGEQGKDGARVHNVEEVETMLDLFRSHGHTEIDTAQVYTGGTSEQYLGQTDLLNKGFKIGAKSHPVITSPSSPDVDIDRISDTPEGLRIQLLGFLEALNVKSLEIWYLHGPDRSVPIEVTLKAVNSLYQEGYFKRFGISNFASWEVVDIVHICRANGYVQPVVYQGIYNAVHRSVEPELFPCLRKFGISFYAFSPLAGGFLADRYASPSDTPDPGSRFDPGRILSEIYRTRYWKEPYFEAVNSVRTVVNNYNLTMAETALRWISHHSLLEREYDDAILIGASSLGHIRQNLIDLDKGPLPEEVLYVLDMAWLGVEFHATKYFQ